MSLREEAKTAATAEQVKPPAPTFEVWARLCITRWALTWKQFGRESAGGAKCKSKQRYENCLLHHAKPLHDLPVDHIEGRHIIDALEPIWHANAEIARHTQMAIGRVLDAAIQAGDRPAPNPSRQKFSASLGANDGVIRGPHKAIAYGAAPAFLQEMRTRDGVGREALELTLLTALRTSEVIEARWGEIDLEAKVWMIPAERTKNAKVLQKARVAHHRVPLSTQAIALLERQHALHNPNSGSDWLFPSTQVKGSPSPRTL